MDNITTSMTNNQPEDIQVMQQPKNAQTTKLPCAVTMELPSLAMAYMPFQKWEETYDPEKGFEIGTIFPCLDKPFLGGMKK